MTDFAPAPWPEDILDYFAVDADFAEVPAFLHGLISKWSATLAISEPNFRYSAILARVGGPVLVYLEDEESYDDGFLDSLDLMMQDLNSAWILGLVD